MSISSATSKGRLFAILVVIWLSYMLSFFHRFAPSGIAQPLAEAFNTNATALGVLASGYFYVYTIMQIPTGVILDTVGPRMLLLFGGIVAAIGSVGFGLATSLEIAILARVVVGVGVSVTFLSMLKVFALTIDESRFSSMVGLGMFIGNIGSMLSGYPLSWLAEHLPWQTIFIFLGGFSLILGVLCWQIIPKNEKKVFVNDGSKTSSASSRFKLRVQSAWAGLKKVVQNRYSWIPTIVNAGLAGCLFGFGGLWAGPWLAKTQGVSGNDAGFIISIYFFGFALGSLFIGQISDRIRARRPPMIIAALIHAMIFSFLTFGMQLPYFLLGTAFFVLGASSSAFTLTWAVIKEVNLPSLSGTSTSFANMAGFLMGGIVQVLAGILSDYQDSLKLPFAENTPLLLPMLLFLLTAIGGFIATLFIRETGARNIFEQISEQKN